MCDTVFKKYTYVARACWGPLACSARILCHIYMRVSDKDSLFCLTRTWKISGGPKVRFWWTEGPKVRFLSGWTEGPEILLFVGVSIARRPQTVTKHANLVFLMHHFNADFPFRTKAAKMGIRFCMIVNKNPSNVFSTKWRRKSCHGSFWI